MGCLDPKLDKERAFALLRKKSATKAVLHFEGGNDEGGCTGIVLEVALPNGGGYEQQDLEVWYCGGYQHLGNGQYGRLSEWENEDQELSELLQGPIDEKYGTWAGDFSAYGTLTWDVEAGTAVMDEYVQAGYDHEQSEWASHGRSVASLSLVLAQVGVSRRTTSRFTPGSTSPRVTSAIRGVARSVITRRGSPGPSSTSAPRSPSPPEARSPSARIGEQHVLEDFGHIPTLADFLRHMTIEKWMVRGARPLSRELSKV